MPKGGKKHGKLSKGLAKKNSKHDTQKRKVKYTDPSSSVARSVRAELDAIIEEIEREVSIEEKPVVVKVKKSEKKRKEIEEKEGIAVKSGMTLQQAYNIVNRLKERPLRNIPAPNYTNEGEGSTDTGQHTAEDYSDTANERPAEYRRGGYHPVVLGDIYNDRYRIVKKLGWGYFSTVWLVWDYQDERYQAMKIQKSAKHYSEAAYDEIKLLSEIMQADLHKTRHCARLNDYFLHSGPHGTHVCMAFDVYGENLLCLMERYEYQGIPLPIVKCITRQVLIALEHLSSINIIHTDLKPENVLLSMPKHSIISLMRHYHPLPLHQRPRLTDRDPKTMTKSQRRRYYKKLAKEKETESKGKALGDKKKNATNPSVGASEGESDETNSEVSKTDSEWEVERFHHVIVADFGNSCWTYKQFTDEVQTRQYRCPEVILGEPYSTPIDIWSCACMVFELITGEFLFDSKKGNDYSRDEDHLALMSELLGDLPECMRLGSGKYRSNYYNSRGELRNIKNLRYWALEDVLHQRYRFTRKKAKEIADFLLPMLEYIPENRATATYMLQNYESFFEIQEDDYEPFCFNPEDAAAGPPAKEQLENAVSSVEESMESYSDLSSEELEGPCKSLHTSDSEDKSESFHSWDEHPLLNRTFLQERGLSIMNIQAVLSGKTLSNPALQEAANEIIRILSEEMEHISNDMGSDGHEADQEDEGEDGFGYGFQESIERINAEPKEESKVKNGGGGEG